MFLLKLESELQNMIEKSVPIRSEDINITRIKLLMRK